MDRLKHRKPIPVPSEPAASDRERPGAPSSSEAAFWMAEFRDLEQSDELREVSRGDLAFPTDEEIARIAREVAAEAPVRRLRSR